MIPASRHAPATAVASFVLTLLPAQSPPPTGAVSIVGTLNQPQTGGLLGQQRIGGICAPAFFRANSQIGAGGVALGGSICWWSEAIHPVLQPLTLHTAGSCIAFFLVSPFAQPAPAGSCLVARSRLASRRALARRVVEATEPDQAPLSRRSRLLGPGCTKSPCESAREARRVVEATDSPAVARRRRGWTAACCSACASSTGSPRTARRRRRTC
jgi:hypothetical protein